MTKTNAPYTKKRNRHLRKKGQDDVIPLSTTENTGINCDQNQVTKTNAPDTEKGKKHLDNKGQDDDSVEAEIKQFLEKRSHIPLAELTFCGLWKVKYRDFL